MQADSAGDEPITSINITPLVDVALVLVIIFMITLPYIMEKTLRVASSQQKVVAVSSVKEPVLVELTGAGLRVDGRAVEKARLAAAVREALSKRGVTKVAVSAERGVKHGKVVEVLDEVMASGAQDMDLLEPGGGGHGDR